MRPDTIMNVIELDRARSRLRGARRVEPPSALGSTPRPAPQARADDGEDRVRMRQNAAAFAVIVAIVVLGSWLIDSLHYHSLLQACVEAGHRNCLPLEPKYLSSPYWR
jgi:soluble lytic murein transglycosylase-like protein